MTRFMKPLALALAAAVSLTAAAVPAVAGDDSDRATAETFLAAGTRLFDAKDAPGLASTYTDDAVLMLVGQDRYNHTVQVETKRGRSEIESYYRTLFQPGSKYHAQNTIESVRRIGPEILLVVGHFQTDTTQANPLKLPFAQVRTRQGDAWRILSIQVFIVPGQ